MSKSEVLKAMFNSDNGGLYAAIGGIVLIFGIDSVVKHSYKVDARKESITLTPATGTQELPKTQEPEQKQ